MIDPNNLCLGCMRELPEDGDCAYCHFDKEEYMTNINPRVLPPQTILAGRYMLGKVLGEGGFGITYLAWDLEKDHVVAIKEYFPNNLVNRDSRVARNTTVSILSGDGEMYFQKGLSDFEEEARTLLKFQNTSGIVSILDFFKENRTAYLVMEYIRGKSLKEYLQERREPLAEKEILKIMSPVIQAMGAIHQAGIVHRDISPDNILMEDGAVTLIDFGASRMEAGDASKSMTVLLKHGYAPPEQYQTRGKQGPWTDIYALCATMYRMASGVVPEEAIDRMIQDDLVPLKKLREQDTRIQVSDGFSDAIWQGLKLRSEERFRSMKALSTGLCEVEARREEYAKAGNVAEEQALNGANEAGESTNTGDGLQQDDPSMHVIIKEKTAQNKKDYAFGIVAGIVVVLVLCFLCIMVFRNREIAYAGVGNSVGDTIFFDKKETELEETENKIYTRGQFSYSESVDEEIRMVQNYITLGYDSIFVVTDSPLDFEEVFKTARDAGVDIRYWDGDTYEDSADDSYDDSSYKEIEYAGVGNSAEDETWVDEKATELGETENKIYTCGSFSYSDLLDEKIVMVERYITLGYDSIFVVTNSPEDFEDVFKIAEKEGIEIRVCDGNGEWSQ